MILKKLHHLSACCHWCSSYNTVKRFHSSCSSQRSLWLHQTSYSVVKHLLRKQEFLDFKRPLQSTFSLIEFGKMFYHQRFLKLPLVCSVEWVESGNGVNASEFFSSLCTAKLISPPVAFTCFVSISFSYSAPMATGPSHMGNTRKALWATSPRGSFMWMWTMQEDLGISSEELPSCPPLGTWQCPWTNC